MSFAERPLPPSFTRDALARYRRNSWAFLGAGVAGWVVAFASLALPGWADDGPVAWITTGLIGGGAVVFLIGPTSLVLSLRMAIATRRSGWQSLALRQVELAFAGWGAPVLAFGAEGEHLLVLVAMKPRWGIFCGFEELLLAGDPSVNGVLATPDGKHLAWARRPRTAWGRERLHRRVAASLAREA